MPSIYGHAPKYLIKQLQVLQNRALKHVHRLPSDYPTTELYSQHALNVMPIVGIISFSTLCIIQKMKLNLISSSITIEKNRNGLRNADDYKIGRSSTESLKRDISRFGAKMHNKIPKRLKDIPKIDKFKIELKKFLLTKLDVLLTCVPQQLLDELSRSDVNWDLIFNFLNLTSHQNKNIFQN